jgi:curved DNA-binding protein
LRPVAPNHYATLGLDRGCTFEQIRAAYRQMAKHHHPDLNRGSPTAVATTQKLNAAHEILRDPTRRTAYDRELDARKKSRPSPRVGKIQKNIFQDVNLRIADFFRGTEREVRVRDPANPFGPETYQFVVPPETAPGVRFRVPRTATGATGFLQLRVRALPSFRFKVRGSDLCCNLRINPARAAQGGVEMIPGATGAMLRVQIPVGAARGEILRLSGEGLPKPRGGRGDLLVRVVYRPKVCITHPVRR